MKMRKLRTLNEFTEAYFRERPDEIDDYLTEIFADFALGSLISG
jgi:DNA-binding phage protein